MISKDYIPRLNPKIHIQALDSSSSEKKYYVEVDATKQYEINEPLFHLLSLMDNQKDIAQIVEEYNRKYRESHSPEDVAEIVEKILLPKRIVVEGAEELDGQERKGKYMIFQIPILKQRFIEKITDTLKYLYTPPLAFLLVLVAVAVHLLYYSRYMEPRLIDIDYILSWKFLIIYILINLDTIFHELGHASALKYFKQEHGNIGIGLYLFMVVLYTDVTKAWRLKRRQRIVVNLGGMFFELIVFTAVFLLYLFSKDTIYLITLFLIDIKIIFSAVPFFRMDGYWVLSDLIGIPNLRKRANELLVYILKRAVVPSTEFPRSLRHFKKPYLFALGLYSVTSNLFFMYVGYRLIRYSLYTLRNIKSEWADIITQFYHPTFSVKALYMGFAYLMGKSLLIIFTMYYLYHFIRKITHLLRGESLSDGSI